MALETVTCDCGGSEVDDEGWCLNCGGLALPRPTADAEPTRPSAPSGRVRGSRDEWGRRTKGRPGTEAPGPPRLILTVVSAAAIIAVTLYGVTHREPAARPPVPPAATIPPQASVPPGVGRRAAETPLGTEVQQVEGWVQAARGLTYRRPVDVRVLDDAAFEREIAATRQVRAMGKSATEQVLRAMGLITGGPDLAETGAGQSSTTIVSYDARTGLLALRDRPLTAYTRSLLARELVRALDDQHFRLWRPELFGKGDESDLAFTALADGDADRLQDAYIEQLSPAGRAEALAERQREAAVLDATTAPRALLEILGFPYKSGRAFVAAMLQRGGQPALDAAFTKPPVTSEQVLHPERYAAGEGPKPVKEPAAADNAVATDRGSIGELGLRLLFDALVGPDQARVAAEGWGGDRYVAWRNDFRSCVRVNLVMDEPALTAKLLGPLNAWDGRQPDADFKRGPDGISVSACR